MRRQLTTFKFLASFLITGLISSMNAASLSLNGLATHSELGQMQYIAGLFAEELSNDGKSLILNNSAKKMEVRILTKLSARRFKRQWIESIAINASRQELEKHAPNIAMLGNLIKTKLMPGDQFVIESKGDHIAVKLNNISVGKIDDVQFFGILLRTWIGPVPLSSQFRQSLLVAGGVSSKDLILFEETQPTEERIAYLKVAQEERKAKKPATKQNTIQQTAQDIAANALKESKTAPLINSIPTPQIPPLIAPTSSIPEDKTAASSGRSNTSPPTNKANAKEDSPESIATTKSAPPAEDDDDSLLIDESPIISSVAPRDLLLDDSVFEEEEEEEELTAENILIEQLYLAKLKKWSHKHLRYPPRAFHRNLQGNVRVKVTINRDGKVVKSSIIERSPHDSLNREAEKANFRASPFPAMPTEIAGTNYIFTVPVSFQIVSEDS